MALWADRSAPHSNAPSSKLRNHAEIVECIRGKLFWGVRVGRVGLLEDYSEGVCVGRVGLLWRPGAGACPNLPQRRSGPGSAANETAEYQRFSSGVPARWGPLWQIWTTGAAAGPVGRASPASARSMTSTPARTPARRTVADRASTPFDRAGPTRAPPGPAQAPRSARSPLNPRERTSSRRSRGLPDDLGGQVTISRVTRRSRGPPRHSPAAPHHRPLNNLPGPGVTAEAVLVKAPARALQDAGSLHDPLAEGEAGHRDHFDIGDRQGDADNRDGLERGGGDVPEGEPQPGHHEPHDIG